jgi:AraC family transcriptional activator FtrA
VAIANRVARRMVVAPHRDGGQAQFIEQPLSRLDDDPIAKVVDHVRAQLREPHNVEDLAAHAHLSPRQFSRRFRAATGTSPAQWLIRERVEASLPLLEHDTRGIEEIGRSVGFNSPASFRKHFRETVGLSPSAWRARFRHAVAPESSRALSRPARSDSIP